MRAIKYSGYCFFIVLSIAILFSCTKMDDGYKDFIKDGEIIYTGRVDSVKTYPGNNRILLSMLLLSDPKISTVKVYWNNKADSAVKNVVRSAGADTVYFMLNNMAEGSYPFEIYTYDNNKHSSVKTESIGISYGQNYINSLFNRSLKSVTYSASKATLKWFGPSSQTVGQQISYIDSLGVAKTVFAAKADTMTILNNFKRLDFFQYKTLYKPDANALDTFYTTSSQSVQVL
ncbi:MAG TPA: DUF4998 domain-containing protein [Chitinophagaceae bacterium]